MPMSEDLEPHFLNLLPRGNRDSVGVKDLKLLPAFVKSAKIDENFEVSRLFIALTQFKRTVL